MLSNIVLRYGVAVLAVVTAWVLTGVLRPVFQSYNPGLLLLIGAVMVSAWYGGLWPGLVSTVLSVIISNHFLFSPSNGATLDSEDFFLLAIFTLVALFVSGLEEVRQRSIDARKRAEGNLKESERQYWAIFELSSVGKTQYSPITNRFLLVNRKFCEITGYSPGELRSMSFSDLTHPDDHEQDLMIYQRVLRGEVNEWLSEKRYIRKDGQIIWVSVAGTMIHDTQGKLAYSVADVQDITHRKQAEQALEHERELLQKVFDRIPVMIAMYEPNTHVLRLNREFERLTGWSTEEASRVNFMEKCYPDPVYRDEVRAFMDSLQEGWRDIVMTTKEGTHLESSWSNIRLSNETHIGIGIDIRERNRAEQRVHEQAALIDMAFDAILVLGLDNRILFWNHGAEETYGFSADEAIGTLAYELLQTQLGQPREAIIATVQQSGRWEGEMSHTRRDAQQIMVTSRWVLLPSFHGQPAILEINRDITERKQAEQRVQLLQELTAAFSRAVTSSQVAETMVSRVLAAFGGNAGMIVALAEDKMINLLSAFNIVDEIRQRYERALTDEAFPLSDALRTRQPIWIENENDFERRYPHLADLARTISTRAMACLPFIVNERVIGGIALSFPRPQVFDSESRTFFMTLADHCAQALERAQLVEQAKEAAALGERQRLARDLHDAVSQTLFSATTVAEALPRLWERNPQRAQEQLQQVVQLNRGAMAEMRTLLLELRPESILKTHLSNLFHQLIDVIKSRKRMQVELVVEGEEYLLRPEAQVALYRIGQESLNNILKHSQATQFTVRLNYQPSQVMLHVKDNGVGFDMEQMSGGLGLGTMRERAEAIKATFSITSRPGEGTEITVTWNQPTTSKE